MSLKLIRCQTWEDRHPCEDKRKWNKECKFTQCKLHYIHKLAPSIQQYYIAFIATRCSGKWMQHEPQELAKNAYKKPTIIKHPWSPSASSNKAFQHQVQHGNSDSSNSCSLGLYHVKGPLGIFLILVILGQISHEKNLKEKRVFEKNGTPVCRSYHYEFFFFFIYFPIIPGGYIGWQQSSNGNRKWVCEGGRSKSNSYNGEGGDRT